MFASDLQKKISLNVSVQPSSVKSAVVQWKPPFLSHAEIDSYHIILRDLTQLLEEHVFHTSADTLELVVPFDLVSGHQYSVTVKASQAVGCSNCVVYKTIMSGMSLFRAVFTLAEMQLLHKKAVDFIHQKNDNLQPIHWLYRNKTKEYFDHVHRNKGIMEVYMKTNGGDPASPINGRLKGLFFSCGLDIKTGLPPQSSPFGPVRFYMPVKLISGNNVNFYFADFYCHFKNHKVTIVVTLNGSSADKFCKQNLLKLDPYHNDFFVKRIVPSPNPLIPICLFFTTTNVWLELFYTESINVPHFLQNYSCYFESVECTSATKVRGLPKNPDCSMCNL